MSELREIANIVDYMTEAKPARCGSYPFRYMAEDFDLPYAVVLNYAEAVSNFDYNFWQGYAIGYVADALTLDDHKRFSAAVCAQLKAIGALT